MAGVFYKKVKDVLYRETRSFGSDALNSASFLFGPALIGLKPMAHLGHGPLHFQEHSLGAAR